MTRNEHDMSNEQAIDLLDNLIGMVEDNHSSDYDTALQMGIKALEQEPQTGHWIIIDDCEKFIAKCSECGQIEDSRMIDTYAYCHCGAKMEGEQNG